MLRADVCNAVEELGQLLDHNGAIGASERNAARIFNADHCFFVTNGTSTTSNKMVWHHTVAPGDVVVVDRNCHKSILHSHHHDGARFPVFLKPTRNHYGIIGPIPQSGVRDRGHPGQDPRQPAVGGRGCRRRSNRACSRSRSPRTTACSTTQRPSRTCWMATSRTCTSMKPGCRTPPSTRSTALSTPMGKKRARPAEVGGVRHAVHPQAAGRHQPGQPRAGAGLAEHQTGPPPLQRGLPDAHQHQPAVQHHRQLRRGRPP